MLLDSAKNVMTLCLSSMCSALPVPKSKLLQIFLEGCHLSSHVLQACGCHILAERFKLILHARFGVLHAGKATGRMHYIVHGIRVRTLA